MNNLPLVSVVMPAYNAEKYLATAIESILTQTYTNFEFIIINDGSTDKTLDIIKTYNEKDKRIRLVSNEGNKGIVYSENLGLKSAIGEYIAIMHADDISSPDRFEKQVSYMETNPHISILGGNMSFVGTEDHTNYPTNSDWIAMTFMEGNTLSHPTVMMRKKDIWNKKLLYDQSYSLIEDYKMWVDSALAGLKITNLTDIILDYRLHESQITSVKRDDISLAVDRLKEEYLKSRFGDTLSFIDKNIIKSEFSSKQYSVVEIFRVTRKLIIINNKERAFDKTEFHRFMTDKMLRVSKTRYMCPLIKAQPTFGDKLWIVNFYMTRMFKKIFHIK